MKIIMMIVGLCLKVADVDETKRIRFAFRAMVAPLRIVEVGERQTATRDRHFLCVQRCSKRKLSKKRKMQELRGGLLLGHTPPCNFRATETLL